LCRSVFSIHVCTFRVARILYELSIRKVMIVILIMTILVYIGILFNIPTFRGIIVFIYLSFTPGFVTLRLFKLKGISFLDTVLLSVGLSITFVMFMGLLVNQLWLFLGFSQSLSIIPLTTAISIFVLTIFFV